MTGDVIERLRPSQNLIIDPAHANNNKMRVVKHRLLYWPVNDANCDSYRPNTSRYVLSTLNFTALWLLSWWLSQYMHVEYCVSAWSPYYVRDKALLDHIQHRFTGMVPGLKSLPYDERLDPLGIWTLEERRNRADLLQVFKLYKGWSIIYSIWSLLHCQYCYEH